MEIEKPNPQEGFQKPTLKPFLFIVRWLKHLIGAGICLEMPLQISLKAVPDSMAAHRHFLFIYLKQRACTRAEQEQDARGEHKGEPYVSPTLSLPLEKSRLC